MTYAQNSEQNKLQISLREMGIDENSTYGFNIRGFNETVLLQLVIYTPTSQSHLGEKFENYKKLNKKNQDAFLNLVFSRLGVKTVFLFKTFTSKTAKKNDLKNAVLEDQNAMICLRCDNGVLHSLYCAIRNAIAHGNIMEKDGYFIFYSVSDNKKEFDSDVTFFMRIKKMNHLKSFIKTLEQYK